MDATPSTAASASRRTQHPPQSVLADSATSAAEEEETMLHNIHDERLQIQIVTLPAAAAAEDEDSGHAGSHSNSSSQQARVCTVCHGNLEQNSSSSGITTATAAASTNLLPSPLCPLHGTKGLSKKKSEKRCLCVSTLIYCYRPPDYSLFALIVTLFVPPLGLPALVCALRARRNHRAGKTRTAWEQARGALLFCIAGMLCMACLLAAIVVFMFLSRHTYLFDPVTTTPPTTTPKAFWSDQGYPKLLRDSENKPQLASHNSSLSAMVQENLHPFFMSRPPSSTVRPRRPTKSRGRKKGRRRKNKLRAGFPLSEKKQLQREPLGPDDAISHYVRNPPKPLQ